jgi:hypothetical protein
MNWRRSVVNWTVAGALNDWRTFGVACAFSAMLILRFPPKPITDFRAISRFREVKPITSYHE